MTDDSNLTPGGEMNDPTVIVAIRSAEEGHWVDWTKDGESGSLGPYLDAAIAENVRAAKELELLTNEGTIDDVIDSVR